jgi:hypothetical protein
MNVFSSRSVRLVKSLAVGVALLGAAFAAGASASADDPAPAPAPVPAPAPAPAPAGVPNAKRWALDFSHGPVRRVEVDAGAGRISTMLYMTMTVENKTPFPRAWRPFVTGWADSRQAPYVAGGYVNALPGIRAIEGNDALQLIDTTGWKKGEEGQIAKDEKKQVVAVFGTIDPHWAMFRIQVEGLVDPITTLKVRKFGDKIVYDETAYAERNAKTMEEIQAAARASGADVPQPVAEYQEVRERRVRAIYYSRQGDEFRPEDDPIRFVKEQWEVLGDPVVINRLKVN